ncbi:MAG: lmo0937 family membrane protein [Terriglobales bacterium]
MASTYSIHRIRASSSMGYAFLVGAAVPLGWPRKDFRFSRRSVTARFSPRRESSMLWTIFIMLLILWLLGLISSYTLGGYIHLLLVVAVVILVVNLLTGRRGAA